MMQISENKKSGAIGKKHYSCAPGLGLIPQKYQPEVRRELKSIFGCGQRLFYYRVKDYQGIPYDTKLAVDALFARFNLSPDVIWHIWED